jgi:hypothetical protein
MSKIKKLLVVALILAAIFTVNVAANDTQEDFSNPYTTINEVLSK